MYKVIISLVSLFLVAFSGFSTQAAVVDTPMRFHCPADTLRLDSLIIANSGSRSSEAILPIVNSFVGVPYKGGTLEGETEMLAINIDEFDCVTLVENVCAIAKALERITPDWRSVAGELLNFRYRKGEVDGYASRLHYFSDWIGENIYKGNIVDVTETLPSCLFKRKTLSYMTRHRDSYPALADSATFARMKSLEEGFRSHRIPYLKKESIGNKKDCELLKSGDIVAFLSLDPDLDVSHVGFIEMREGKPYLIHASSKAGKVVREERPLSDYLKHEGRNSAGLRILRLKD